MIGIGLVAALAVESAAVQLMVDDVVREPVAGDPNLYRSGWLPSRDPRRPHRVVLAVQTRDGTRNAAALCANLARSFPDLRHVLLCGIAGGIPAPNTPDSHVRLGDVVSATEGIVDYDHVRTVDGHDYLRRPAEGLSKALLRADREIEARELAGSASWFDLLEAGRRPVPAEFARPPDGSDVLLRNGRRVPHPGPPRAGRPVVHRAAIGSADRLVRDARKRDQLATRFRVRAVEMEGSGVAVASD